MLNKKSETSQILELDQLKQDKDRLIKLLRATKEYREFADFADDNGGSLRFLSSDEGPQKKKRGTGAKQPAARAMSPPPDPDMEKNNWVPEEAYNLAHEVRNQTSGEISPKLMNKLLISLNKIWRLRERQTEQRLRQKYSTEIDKLKREKSMKGQYDSVHAKKSLARVRGQLK